VVVVDNNTAKEETWRPVQQHCARLGEHFRFYHVADLTGYKAGALNYALQRADSRAEVIAVVDADYCVHPNWLKDLTPPFRQAEIGIVQAPQDYRDGAESAFKALCHAEYKGFFHLGMVTRNERNAIIQHGTMTLVRRSFLESAGCWGVSTVTEDTELGLRVLEQGHEAVYIDKSYGKGLVPDTFLDYKNQRYRWAYGAMQILREHAGELLGYKPSLLTAGQRYHFVSGWLPWMADGLNLVFSLMALLWSALMLWAPLVNNAPPLLISVIPIMFFSFRVTKLLALYLGPVRSDFKTAMAATLAGLSLSYTIGRASLSGLLIGRRIPFVRTPKMSRRMPLLSAIGAARDETLLMLMLLGLLAGLYLELDLGSKENLAWCLVLLTQCLPYFSALVVSVVAVLPSRQKTENGMILP
jgi:cellulose synthase/poly-beta-1,6-N-acetylglucosamine synthase-like glycosyltransferase